MAALVTRPMLLRSASLCMGYVAYPWVFLWFWCGPLAAFSANTRNLEAGEIAKAVHELFKFIYDPVSNAGGQVYDQVRARACPPCDSLTVGAPRVALCGGSPSILYGTRTESV